MTGTPNCVVRSVAEAGWMLDADTKGNLELPMARTMVDILVDELGRASVPAFVAHVPTGWLSTSIEQDHGLRGQLDDENAFLIRRYALDRDANGDAYGHQYLHEAGTWVPDRAQAQMFTDLPVNRVEQLWHQRHPGRGQQIEHLVRVELP